MEYNENEDIHVSRRQLDELNKTNGKHKRRKKLLEILKLPELFNDFKVESSYHESRSSKDTLEVVYNLHYTFFPSDYTKAVRISGDWYPKGTFGVLFKIETKEDEFLFHCDSNEQENIFNENLKRFRQALYKAMTEEKEREEKIKKGLTFSPSDIVNFKKFTQEELLAEIFKRTGKEFPNNLKYEICPHELGIIAQEKEDTSKFAFYDKETCFNRFYGMDKGFRYPSKDKCDIVTRATHLLLDKETFSRNKEGTIKDASHNTTNYCISDNQDTIEKFYFRCKKLSKRKELVTKLKNKYKDQFKKVTYIDGDNKKGDYDISLKFTSYNKVNDLIIGD